MIILSRIKEKLDDPGFKRYFSNTGWLFVGKMFSLVVSFFVGAYVARYLGPDRYGLLSYVVSFVGLFAFVSSLGVDNILNRDLVKYPEKRDMLLGSGFAIKIVGSLVAIIVISVITLLTNKDGFTNLMVILYSLTFILQSFNVIDIYFQSKVLSKNTVKIQTFSTSINAIFKLILIFLNLNVFWFLISYIFDTIIVSVGFVIIYNKNFNSIKNWHFDKVLTREVLKNSWPLMLAGAAYSVYSRIDQVIIKNLIDNAAVGVYSAAVKISEIWYFVPTIVCSSLFPAIINARKVSQELYQFRLRRLYSLMFWLAVIVALPISVFASLIIKLLFGTAYLGAVVVLQIYVWAGVAIFLGTAVSQYLIAENFTKISFYTLIIGALANIVLNFIFIPKFGINGAALATLLSYTLSTFSVIFFKKSRDQGLVLIRSIIGL